MDYDPFAELEPPEADVTVPLAEEPTAVVQAGPVTMTIDLDQLLQSSVWGGRTMESAADAIVTAAASLLVDRIETALTAEIIQTAKVTIEGRVNHIVEDALTNPIEENDGWGGRKKTFTLTDRIREAVKEATTWRPNARYDSDKSAMQRYVTTEVVKVVKADVDGAIKEVREAADKVVRTETTKIVNEAIDRAKARF